MPCRDYESDSWDSSYDKTRALVAMKEQADKLARIACKAMETLEENGVEDFLLLKDDEVRQWWQAHKEADRKEKARVAEQERKTRVRAEALARLSDEEKELLGLAKPKKQAVTKKGKVQPRSWSEANMVDDVLEEFNQVFVKTYTKDDPEF